jgi:hypothetical protein
MAYGKIQGTRNENVQYIELPSTILNILGHPVPEWMEVRSLCEPPCTELRPILSVQPKERKTIVGEWKNVDRYAPALIILEILSIELSFRWF